MTDRRPQDPEAVVLSEAARERVLRRASELDAARAGTRVADLRQAAAEAGISPAAFDEAVAELQLAESGPVATPRPRSRLRSLLIGASGTVMFLILTVGVVRMVVPVRAPAVTATLVEQTFTMRCLSPHDAMTLIRQRLTSPQTSMWSRQGSNVITVQASARDMELVRGIIAENDGPNSNACTLPRR